MYTPFISVRIIIIIIIIVIIIIIIIFFFLIYLFFYLFIFCSIIQSFSAEIITIIANFLVLTANNIGLRQKGHRLSIN